MEIKQDSNPQDLENLLSGSNNEKSFSQNNPENNPNPNPNPNPSFTTSDNPQSSKAPVSDLLHPEIANEFLHKGMKLAGELIYKITTQKKIEIKWYADEKRNLLPYVEACLKHYSVNFANPLQALGAAMVMSLTFKVVETVQEQDGGLTPEQVAEKREKKPRKKRRTKAEVEAEKKAQETGEKMADKFSGDLTGTKLTFEDEN